LTICDPACGSGAFLNQALEFLIAEHKLIDELMTKLLGGELVLPNVENTILENNLFGVDINNESVEIAKLSLWLRTAKHGRKLTTLNDNIKCGNSIIDDQQVAGNKAFHWESEFPEVFENGGFDVVIGNPPYGAKLEDQTKSHLTSKYSCFKGNYDIYSSFMELAFILCKINSYWGFINPVSWQSGEHYLGVRKYLVDNGKLEIGIKLPYNVFSDAYVDTGVYIFKKERIENYKSLVYEFPVNYKKLSDLSTESNLISLNNNKWVKLESLKIVLNPSFYTISPKVHSGSILLSEISKSIRGILASKEDIKDSITENLKPYYIGGLYRYIYSDDFCGVHYGEHLKEKPKDFSFFQGERILIRRLINRRFRVMAAYTEKEFINKKDLYNLKLINDNFTLKYILAIINSQLISYLKTKGSTTATKDDFGQLTLTDIRKIPIKSIPMHSQANFVSKVDLISENKISFDKLLYSLQKYIKSIYYLEKLSKKLQNWFELEFGDFIKELNNAIKKSGNSKLTKTDEMEWMEIFSTKKSKYKS